MVRFWIPNTAVFLLVKVMAMVTPALLCPDVSVGTPTANVYSRLVGATNFGRSSLAEATADLPQSRFAGLRSAGNGGKFPGGAPTTVYDGWMPFLREPLLLILILLCPRLWREKKISPFCFDPIAAVIAASGLIHPLPAVP